MRSRHSSPLRVGAIVLLLGSSACAAQRLPDPTGVPVPDPAGFVERLRDATLPAGPQQVNFGWTLDERGSRVRGSGVVRHEAPQRIRLDLFGPRDETYLIAALEAEEYRLPSQLPAAISLPSPSFLWAALGVFSPPSRGTIASATAGDGTAEVRFDGGAGEVFAFTFEAHGEDGFRLARAERAGRQGVIETVMVERADDGTVIRTHYRDWAEFRDLTLDVEAIRSTPPFPPNIWRPDVAAR